MSETPEKIRIQKWLSSLGTCSRREAERLIADGKISVNGTLVTEMGFKVDPMVDTITIAGKSIGNKEPPRVYWMFNKPDRVLTAARAQAGKSCLYDLPKFRKLSFKVSPVGRLDYRTEGLLLLSNDGEMVFRLSHPSFKLPREYQAMINRRLTDEEEAKIKKGVTLKDGPVQKIKLKYMRSEKLGKTSGYWYLITVYEGRNRLVRRIFEHFETSVIRLIRSSFGDISLDIDLKPGDYRQLSAGELKYLKQQVGLSGAGHETSKPKRRQ